MESQELKEILGQQAKDIIADGMNFKFQNKTLTNCPFHNDSKPSMSWFKEGLMYRCHACEEHMDIYRYYQEFEGMSFQEAMEEVAMITNQEIDTRPKKSTQRRVRNENSDNSIEKGIISLKKEYDKPDIELQELGEAAIKYMELRGIKKETLDELKVKQRRWGGNDVYVFQYFNTDNELEFVTYRGIGKGALKGGCEANTKSILWNMNNIDTNKPVVLVEGQPDLLIVHQSGYENVVSVPSGSNNMGWIDNCWDWLKEIKELIIWADNDGPGLKMADTIDRRLGNIIPLIKVTTSEHGKDANEVHFRKGPEEVFNTINRTIKQVPDGILDVSQVAYTSLKDQEEGIETGFREIDEHLNDLRPGEVTVMFGRNNEGKTTVIGQMIGNFVMNNNNPFIFTGELTAQKFQEWIYKQVVGNRTKYMRVIEGKYRNRIEPKPETIKAIKEWHDGSLYLYDNTTKVEGNRLDHLFKIMELAATRYGCRVFVIDNMMSILETTDNNINSSQNSLMQQANRFAVTYNVHVIIVAHPNKEGMRELEDGSEGNLEKWNVSGTANITNNTDNIIAVERFWGDYREYDAVITILKDREDNPGRMVGLYNFDTDSFRYYSYKTPRTVEYGWEKKAEQYLLDSVKMNNQNLVNPTSEECPF